MYCLVSKGKRAWVCEMYKGHAMATWNSRFYLILRWLFPALLWSWNSITVVVNITQTAIHPWIFNIIRSVQVFQNSCELPPKFQSTAIVFNNIYMELASLMLLTELNLEFDGCRNAWKIRGYAYRNVSETKASLNGIYNGCFHTPSPSMQ